MVQETEQGQNNRKVFTSQTKGKRTAFVPTPSQQIAITADALETLDPNLRAYLIDLADREQEAYNARQKAEADSRAATSMALTDPLTGVGNRNALDQQMSVALQKLSQQNTTDKRRKKTSAITIAFIDANDFGLINKTLGNECGDAAIEAIGKFFNDKMRKGDFVARKGGDEFVIMMQAEEQDAKNKLASLKADFSREVTAQFLAKSKALLGNNFDSKVAEYRAAIAKKYTNPQLERKEAVLSFSFGVKTLSPAEVVHLDTKDIKAVGEKIVHVMAASDEAQRADKEAFRASQRNYPQESNSQEHPLISTKESPIKKS